MLIRPALVLLTLLVPTLATAQGAPRSVGECERLKNDLAFNQCLAMFGPAAKNVAGGFTAGAASASASVATALAAIPPGIAAALPPVAETGRRGRRSRYTRHGRQSASFDTSGGSRQYRRHRRR